MGGEEVRWKALYHLWEGELWIELDGIEEHTVQVMVRGAGDCNLRNATYRFRVTKSSQCLKKSPRWTL